MFPYLDSGKKIPMYGVFFMIGIVTALLAIFFLDKQKRIKRMDLAFGASLAIVGGLIGAKLLAVLPNIQYIIDNKIPFVDIIKNGFVFYGGIIGGAIGIIIYCKAYHIDTISFLDTAAIGLPLGSLFGRIGCFCSGCCFGRPTDSILGVIYSHPIDPNTPIGISLLPTQLFESAYCLIIFIVILILNRKKMRGANISFYIIAYSVCRFINEFFRGDFARGFLWGMSTSQFISVLLVLINITVIVIFAVKKRHNLKKEKSKFYISDEILAEMQNDITHAENIDEQCPSQNAQPLEFVDKNDLDEKVGLLSDNPDTKDGIEKTNGLSKKP